MEKKIEIKVLEGDSEKILETLSYWASIGVKYYVIWHGHFYGFGTKQIADKFIPRCFIETNQRKDFKELKINGEWVIKEIPITMDEFNKIYFGIMECKLQEIENRVEKLYSSKLTYFEFINNDDEIIFSSIQNYSSVNEGDLVSFIPENVEEELTYRVISIIKCFSDDDFDVSLTYKIAVQPYVEGVRRVLSEKLKNN